ncbi:hypothetical protein [uncultured Aquimarina sp.]|uniref:hypothetical protein n=1 Tax=uncultured Aquimarina sp. TaxID=575652 RepID=UPI0026192E17|nr:hypothetical protein [uncultured Aquimarina sp.]
MKLYNPLFSIIVIIIQLILSLKDYYELQEWKKENPELDSLINVVIQYDTFFLFVLIIGIYEMLTKPSWFKILIRIFLVCIILGTEFSGLIPIEDFKSGIYNTAWFSAVVAIVLILIRIGKYGIKKMNNRKLNKASR